MTKKILIWLSVLVAFLLIGGFVFAYRLSRQSLPKVTGELRLTGLEAPVEVVRDLLGIPHIYASTSHDLFFAQGFIHAQDRFWQMDFWRHLSSGTLTEILGESQLSNSKFLRTMGWRKLAEQEYQMLSPAHKAILDAYADGVNAYLVNHQGAELSLQHAIIETVLAPGYNPEPWSPVDTLSWAKVMAYDLGGNMNLEIERSILLTTLSPQLIEDIIPPYPSRMPLIVDSFQTTSYNRQTNLVELIKFLDSQAFDETDEQFRSVQELLGPLGQEIGSNNWVIGGSRTATGKPMLADDMHLGEQIPSIWYEIDLQCSPKGPACPFRVAGFSFAGVPGVIVGHNDRIAWGFTNVGPDVQDLYIEKINPVNPNQYEYKGQWLDMETRTETFTMPDGSTTDETVRSTKHGPLITDVYGPLKDFQNEAAIEIPEQYAIALSWTALQPLEVVKAILGMNLANNWDEYRQAVRNFAAPSQNMVFADVDGNIGYQMPGNIPIRVPGHTGELPVPGWTGEYDWQGYIPFDELPYSYNPAKDYIATANNAVVGPDYPYIINLRWSYGYRAARIVEMIENAPGKITSAYIQQMHGDNKNLNAMQLVPLLMQIQLEDARSESIRTILKDWDFQDDQNLAAPAVFNSFWKHLLMRTFADQLPERYLPGGGGRWFEVVYQLTSQPDNAWWDDIQTAEKEDRDAMFRLALVDAVTELEEKLGKNQAKWTWGDLHTLTFHEPSLGKSGIAPLEALFNKGPFPVSGGSDVVNANSWSAVRDDYTVRSLVSERLIVDLSDFTKTQSVITTGQSGQPYSTHFADQIDLWRNIQYHPFYWERSQVDSNQEGLLRLIP